MNRTIAAALSSILMIAIFFGLATAYQSCGKKKDAEELSTAEKAVQVADTYTEESYFEDEGAPSTGDETNTEDPPDASNQDDPAEVDNSTPPAQNRPAAASSGGGRYLIVAGNYLVRSNAESMVNKLKNAGYQDASMTVFDLSQYYTVIAGRYDSRSSANNVSGQLKNMGIDNYVLTKK